MGWKFFGLVMIATYATSLASADAQVAGRYVAYPEAKITSNGAAKVVTILVDSATGRAWQLISDKVGEKWSPILYCPCKWLVTANHYSVGQ
jgi:hypothetical protein